MIDFGIFDKISQRNQTTRFNVLREYAQHLFLSSFYRKEGTEKILFKGGTALRFVYKSPRFSEDLDFSADEVRGEEIEKILEEVLVDLENQNQECEIEEAKPTSGGYLANLATYIDNERIPIAVQISLRKKMKGGYQTLPITNEYIPSYVANVLPLSELAGEKVQAALTRAKPRDFFDIYFLLREGLLPGDERGKLPEVKVILESGKVSFGRELALFLPLSMKTFVKDFPRPLLVEMER